MKQQLGEAIMNRDAVTKTCCLRTLLAAASSCFAALSNTATDNTCRFC
jgi:hypothetical protein